MTTTRKHTRHGILPGDLPAEKMIERSIRVDHAGEYGAVRIYEGQLAVLGRSQSAEAIRHMADQERKHLARFEELVGERRVRPTALLPLWHGTGFMLGAATGLMGEKAAMACTVAIEEVIDDHYAQQAERLGDDESELRETIEQFRNEELEHRDSALAHGAEEAAGYDTLTRVVRAGSRMAIWLSERI